MKKTALLLVAILLVILAPKAQAYITPGEGSDIVRILLTALTSIGVFFRNIWNKITRKTDK